MKGILISISLLIIFKISNVQNGAIEMKESSDLPGLYGPEDKVVVISKTNFNDQVLNKNNAWLIEFYNSWCGFCKKFAPEWKLFATDVANWKNIVSVGAIDCANDANNDICRNYEIMAYPTLKYFHEQFVEGPQMLGETITKGNNAQDIREILVQHLQKEQSSGNGKNWPLLTNQHYNHLEDPWTGTPSNIKVIFLIFEPENSTLASEVILDLNLVFGILVRKVSSTSSLAMELNLTHFPNLQVVDKVLSVTALTPKHPNRISLRKAIITYLRSRKMTVPKEIEFTSTITQNSSSANNIGKYEPHKDVVYLADLETGLRYTLSNEISKMKHITGNSFIALQEYLHVMLKYFPFTDNGKVYMNELRRKVLLEPEGLTGEKFETMSKELQREYTPAYVTHPDWVGCRGSMPNYRGFSCSLWTIFHVLTVRAAEEKASDALEVLRALHGYVKHFFGCSDCSEHFQAMAERLKLFSVAENDGAILWLWVAHNEVNHRLSGDSTEDPQFPKKQFPVAENCPKCWREGEAWDIDEVLQYLKQVYGFSQIQFSGSTAYTTSSYTFIQWVVFIALILLVVAMLRLVLKRRCYRKKTYKHDTFGKV